MSVIFEVRRNGPRLESSWAIFECSDCGFKKRIETYQLLLEGNKVFCVHDDESRNLMHVVEKGGDWREANS